MSERINTSAGRASFRRQLLTTVSALALLASVYGTSKSKAANSDEDRPTIWIELGGQFERVDSSQAIFSPPFFDKASAAVLAPMVDVQSPSRYSIGGEGKLTFAPHDSNWVFSASVRYGRSNAARHLHYETRHPTVPFTSQGKVLTGAALVSNALGDGQSNLGASHAIVDFQAGRDIGVGLFGAGSMSVVSAGVRFAQFNSSSEVTLHARPIYGSLPPFGVPGEFSFHSRFLQNNTAVIDSRRSSRAVGPSLAWDASVPVAGNDSSMTVAFDWGLNAAFLFGRQRAHIHHQTTGAYFKGLLAGYRGNRSVSSYAHGPYDHDRARTVTIPNVGGFAGVTFRYVDAKISLGYRGDFFFGAMDGGIDVAHKENVGFYGPFASVSVGIGG